MLVPSCWAAPHLHLTHPPMDVTKQPSHTSPAHTRWEDPSSLAPCPNPWPDKSGFLQSSPRSRPPNQLQPFFRFIYGTHLRRKTPSPSLIHFAAVDSKAPSRPVSYFLLVLAFPSQASACFSTLDILLLSLLFSSKTRLTCRMDRSSRNQFGGNTYCCLYWQRVPSSSSMPDVSRLPNSVSLNSPRLNAAKLGMLQRLLLRQRPPRKFQFTSPSLEYI